MTSVSNRGVNKYSRGIKAYDYSALSSLEHYYRSFTMSEDNMMSGAASSGTTGFFQQTPTVANSFYEDEGYKRVFSCESQLHFISMCPLANTPSLSSTRITAIAHSRSVQIWLACPSPPSPRPHSRCRAQLPLRTDLGCLWTPRGQPDHLRGMEEAFCDRDSRRHGGNSIRE